MKVLITGAKGYIGSRLLPVLLGKGHEVICLVRDKYRFRENSDFGDKVKIITGDLLKESSIEQFPVDIDAAYYLAHSIPGNQEFSQLEALSAYNFVQSLNKTNCKQIVFLDDMVNDDNLSKHLTSRWYLVDVLAEAKAKLTVLRTAIIIGPGSAAFGIIRDLTEKLPVMITPAWVNTRSQPIAVRDVLGYLESVLLNKKTYGQTFDIGGPDILSFKDMILIYAKVRKLQRTIITLPFLSPKISSYWLYLVTTASYPLAQSLVDSMKNETIAQDNRINEIAPRKCLTYVEALNLTLEEIEQSSVIASLKDAI